ncbi:Cysteine desulfurase [Minicystis rosea]|nr:Cysteine desulfurase [Minicystis rosea]
MTTGDGGGRSAAPFAAAWDAMSTVVPNLPDPAALAQLANEFFAALPGEPAGLGHVSSPGESPSSPRPIAAAPAAIPSFGAAGIPSFATPPSGAPATVSPGVIPTFEIPYAGAPPSVPSAGASLYAPYAGRAAAGPPASFEGQPFSFVEPSVTLPVEADLHGIIASLSGSIASPSPGPVPSGVSAGGSLYFLEEAAQRARAASTPAVVSSEIRPEIVPHLGTSRRPFDAHAIRRDFPILSERVHGKPLVWLDNAATTQKPRQVIERISSFYEHENSNIHRAAHALAGRATDAYEAAREKTRAFLNAGSTREIVFVRGATEGINFVAQSFGRRYVEQGDEIVITWLEHHSNIVPWQMLCAEKGARLRVVPVDDHGQVLLDAYEKLLGPRTRLVALTHVSNALGTVLPVREMVDMAHRHGARVLVDGAQAVSHMPVDVQALDCDFYVFSGHKVFAPTGIGVVRGKEDVLDTTPPWQGGGNMIADVTFEKTVYQPAPSRFEAGTGNIADAVGLGAALDYLAAVGMENVARHEHDLLEYATNALCGIPGLHLWGTAREKAGVLSFTLDGFRTGDIGAALDREGIAVRSGHHCAQPALRRFGLESTVRPSLALYNTTEDIDALVAALRRLRGGPADRRI